MVGRPSRRSGRGRRPSRWCGTGRDTLPEIRKWSGDSPGGLEVVGDPPECPEVVGRNSRRSGSCRKIRPEVRKWSGDPPRGPEVVV